jgi:bacteriorhodopsin
MNLALLQTGNVAADALQSGASSFWLWFTWGGMTLATIAFLWMATTGSRQQIHHYVASAVITLWAAMNYLVMAIGGGTAIVGATEGPARLFYYARYIDWTLTTPLLLLGLAWVAMGGSIRRNTGVIAIIVVADVLMILTGLIAGATEGFLQALFFIISCIFFAIVLYFIWVPNNSLAAEARRGQTEGRPGLFFTLATTLTVLWILYPIVFLIGTEGFSVVSSSLEVFFYAVLDILAKIAFGFILLGGIRTAQRA